MYRHTVDPLMVTTSCRLPTKKNIINCLNVYLNNYVPYSKGPSIYDVHTEGGQAQVDACGRPHRKLKLESTDVILSSSRAKKLASFLPEFCLWTEKVKIFLRHKLVI